MTRMIFPFIILFVLSSCNNEELKRDNQRLRDELRETKNELREANQTKSQLSNQVSDLARKKELDNKAESTPLKYDDYGFTIKNITREGTEINSSGPFEKDRIRYINISTYFKNYVGESGRTLYGTLYIRYIDPNGNTLGNSDYFYQRNGSSAPYTFKKEINSSSSSFSYGSGWGSNSGGTYSYRGKYKVEFWFDKDNNDKAYKLCETSFEVF